jgi:hypothetical protein
MPVTKPRKRKIYQIRLNPDDAKYGLDTKQERAKRFEETGTVFSSLALSAWQAARDSTNEAIFKSLPKDMQAAITAMRPKLPQLRPDAGCLRCGGKGYREDKKHWIVIAGQTIHGKVCFKCMGSGIEPSMEPVFFRRRAIDTLRCVNETKAREWADKVLDADDNPYQCVLLDIAQAIIADQDYTKLPH